MKDKRHFALVVILLGTTGSALAQPGMPHLDFTPLDSLVTSWMDRGFYPGGAVAVGRESQTLFSKCYGGFTEETPVYVASAGKWAAAAVVAAVVDRTQLDWDDPVSRWIPEATGTNKEDIPLRRLLSHTSGVMPYLPLPKVDEYNHLSEAVKEILPLENSFSSGTRFEYGGLAMQLAGRMAELAMGGEEFESLFQRLIADPLEMTGSHFVPVNTEGGHSPMLGGGLCTTLKDYSHFLQMILSNGEWKGQRILSVESIREMQADQVGDAAVGTGEFVERGLGQKHNGIYGLGEWRELIDEKGEAYQISSPGWAGAYPWINKRERVWGFFIAHVQGPANRPGFSSFYGSPVLSKTVSRILRPHRRPQVPDFPTVIPDMTEDLTSKSGKLPRDYHPSLVPQNAASVRAKIAAYDWARESYEVLRSQVTPYVERHRNDPQWIISRMAMYWGKGEHFTQCYLKNQNWDYGEGNAPVPTVRLPGMRTWNEYVNVPLEDRIPYNASGDMLGLDRRLQNPSPELIPYKESGHMVRSNNVEILTLAERAAFVYWLTGDEAYGKFASDIYQTWVLGIFYMQPILDPDRSTGGPGGWAPDGICGYYDYEQIHDDTAMHGAAIYAFAYDYLAKHPSKELKATRKNIKDLSEIVFKRFVNLGMVRGGRSGNWNINGWNCMLLPILVLDSNAAYPNGQGREYYLHFLTDESTRWRASLPEAVRSYDPVTGLWPESPGYAFSTIDMLMDWAGPLRNVGVDIIARNPIVQKAAMAVFPWLDDRSNLVIFGDSRGGTANFETFERLLSYYQEIGDEQAASLAASSIRKGLSEGVYSRVHPDWKSICFYAGDLPDAEKNVSERSSYSRVHRFITLKNPGEAFPMMATLYGGNRRGHMTANGLAAQFYGFGYSLAPDASGYVSYWSDDYVYHQSATGSNTILPGYLEGPVEVAALDPQIDENSFTNGNSFCPYISFADMKASEKERIVSAVRTSDGSGYYVDIFYPGVKESDYWMHTVGTAVEVTDRNGIPIPSAPLDSLVPSRQKGYGFLKNIRISVTSDPFVAAWSIPEGIGVNFWMNASEAREVVTADAPSTSLYTNLTPGGASGSPLPTPTLVVRQKGFTPYVGVYEPFKGKASVAEVKFDSTLSDITLDVLSDHAVMDRIVRNKDCHFGLVRTRDGEPELLYLGKGTVVGNERVSLKAEKPGYAAVWKENGIWHYSTSNIVLFTIEGQTVVLDAGEGVCR